MSALRLRPAGLRLPWQALVALAVVLYIVESAMRGWDFTPDILDFVVFGLFAVVIFARPIAERVLHDDDPAEAEGKTEGEDKGTL